MTTLEQDVAQSVAAVIKPVISDLKALQGQMAGWEARWHDLGALRERVAVLEVRAPISGPPGAKGDDGQPGVDGKHGIDGLHGKDGAPGRDGLHGKDGAPGLHGADGASGLAGKNGLDGKDGTAGLNGQDGAPGLAGKDGHPGTDGANGLAGKDGRDGVDGKDGAPGLTGKDGRDGIHGKDGAAAVLPDAWVGRMASLEQKVAGFPVVTELDPDDCATHFTAILRKELLTDVRPQPRMQKRVIRDESGKVERVVDEPAAVR